MSKTSKNRSNLKLVIGFCAILAIFAALQHAILHRLLVRSVDEGLQRLHAEVASNIATTLRAELRKANSADKIKEHIFRINQLNPQLDIFLINASGKVLVHLPGSGELKNSVIDMAPIERFLSVIPNKSLPILGDNPRRESDEIFTVAPLNIRGEPLFVYAIIKGERFSQTVTSLENDYFSNGGLIVSAGLFLLFTFIGSSVLTELAAKKIDLEPSKQGVGKIQGSSLEEGVSQGTFE